MMGNPKGKLSGEEMDAFSAWGRMFYRWKPGRRKAAKRRFQRRVRRAENLTAKNSVVDSEL